MAIEDINFCPFQGPLKFTQSGIFGLTIYHLAALIYIHFCQPEQECSGLPKQ
jgi:hypothetical protein